MANETMRVERKVVTALFADVVGSTGITERLNREDARELLGAAVASMIEAVDRFGGTVKDLAGDGVLALFGAPVAHEDDAERAIRAGLLIVKSLGSHGDDRSRLSVRVGIESGLVVLGPVGAGARVEHVARDAGGRDVCDPIGRLRADGVETAGVELDPVLNKEYVCFRDPDNVQWEFYSR